MDKHKDVFEDTDENKLEYTPIFEEYVQILQQTIDSKLYEKYQHDQVIAFYEDFKVNH